MGVGVWKNIATDKTDRADKTDKRIRLIRVETSHSWANYEWFCSLMLAQERGQ
jgi:hypothetical protein